ncbi:MAG: nuclear transport factor 2 family protein [Candidatus Acidiferrum sp.]
MMNRTYSRRNFWLRISLVLAAGVLAGLSAAATDKMDVMATVHQFVDSFNKGEVKTVIATCAAQTSIIDEFSPYTWNGAGACAKWIEDYDADAKKNGITDGIVKLGEAWHVDITNDRAYVVIPANYTFKEKGKVVTESKSVITIALQKSDGGWRINGWTWSKH